LIGSNKSKIEWTEAEILILCPFAVCTTRIRDSTKGKNLIMSDQEDISLPQNYEVDVSIQMPDWEEFLAQYPLATIYHDPRWGQVMRLAYANYPFYLTAHCNGKITGILQLVAQKSLIFGSHLCSLPYFDASGILAQDDLAAKALISTAHNLLKEQRAQWIELRHLQPITESIPYRCDKVTMHLALPESQEKLWLQLKPKVRNQVRKAQRGFLETEQGGAELINEFYTVYARNMRDLGSPPHSRRFFQLVIKYFPDESRIYLIRFNGKAIAGSFSLRDRNALRVPWAANDWRFKGSNANMLLYWAMLTDGSRTTTKYFDFGRSSRNSGTYNFKKQWGAKEVPLFWQFVLAEGKNMPDMTADSKKYRYMVTCWKKLPVWAVRCLGPRLISKLS